MGKRDVDLISEIIEHMRARGGKGLMSAWEAEKASKAPVIAKEEVIVSKLDPDAEKEAIIEGVGEEEITGGELAEPEGGLHLTDEELEELRRKFA